MVTRWNEDDPLRPTPFHEGDAARIEARRRVAGGLSILVVDDDELCLSSIEALLILDGHHIFTATRGLEAVDCARRIQRELHSLDLSILDCNMPDISGIETFERLLAEQPRLEGIFISGEVTKGLEERVRRVGGRVLVPKPLNVGRLRNVVEQVAISLRTN